MTDYVSMFIDECGGYTIISSKEKDGGYNLLDQPWIGRLQDREWVERELNNRLNNVKDKHDEIRESDSDSDWDDDDDDDDDWGE